jgi:hypothetical protein
MGMDLSVIILIFGRPAERRPSVLLCMETLRARSQATRYLRMNRCSTMSGSADSREKRELRGRIISPGLKGGIDLFGLTDSSTVEHHQRMEVDYVRTIPKDE